MNISSDVGFDHKPELPVAISFIGGRYLLFDVKIATYLRREHHICGTAIGTLPLSPSQNLFLGVPIEIMPEEAQLLVEKGVGLVVDDARAHDLALRPTADKSRRADYLAKIQKQSRQVEQLRAQEKEQSRKRALSKRSKNSAGDSSSSTRDDGGAASLLDFDDGGSAKPDSGDSGITTSSLNETPVTQTEDSPVKVLPNTMQANSYQVTPATSRLLLPPTPSPPSSSSTPQIAIKDLPSSYPLYKHLHTEGFFMTPGLRFGCQYTVYPGDPLRFHSHFLAVGAEWEEQIDLMDIVGGGRLGTGVKKGYLLGGASPSGDVRTFSVEWAAM